jgi:hypothetical protein
MRQPVSSPCASEASPLRRGGASNSNNISETRRPSFAAAYGRSFGGPAEALREGGSQT